MAAALTAAPSCWNGLNFHFFMASAAGLVSTGLPETGFTASTWPFSAITTSTSTAPEIFNWRAIAGYSGCTFWVAWAIASDWETFLVALWEYASGRATASNQIVFRRADMGFQDPQAANRRNGPKVYPCGRKSDLYLSPEGLADLRGCTGHLFLRADPERLHFAAE